jgi:hypothetical protein
MGFDEPTEEPENNTPFDKEPFDAGVDADEESDPKKFIEQLSGKLGQSLRDYTKNQGQPDFELEKFAINSVISATNTAEMDEEDRNDIIKKINSSGESDEPEMSNDTFDDPTEETGFDEPTEETGFDEPVDDVAESGFHVYEAEDLFLSNPKKNNMFQPNSNDVLDESNPCWKGYKQIGMKTMDGKEVPNCVPINEAEYKGKKVTLNKPMSGDVKKFKVYVKNDKGNVIKVNFGDPNMEIKRDDPDRKKSFRARHDCANAKDKTTARYWSCKMWSDTPVSKIVNENDLNNHKKNSIFDKNYLKMKLIETFNHEEPLVLPAEPITKPKESPVVQPSRRDKPFLPLRESQPKPKAKE